MPTRRKAEIRENRRSHRRLGPFASLLVVLGLLGGTDGRAFGADFPTPVNLALSGPALTALPVDFVEFQKDYLVVGTLGGFISLHRQAQENAFSKLQEISVGGRVVDMIPWEGRPLAEPGLVVASADPDRLHFVRLFPQFPHFQIVQSIELEEDPGTMAFVGDVSGADPELAVSLPGIDQITFLKQEQGLWVLDHEVTCGDHPRSLAGIDLDGDLLRELVAAQSGFLSGNLGVFVRGVSGRYEFSTRPFPAGWPSLVLTTDADQDGQDELIVATSDIAGAVVLVDQGGTFVQIGTIPLTFPAGELLALRFEAGVPGIINSNGDRGQVEFFQYLDGDWVRGDSYYPGSRPHALAACDFDGEGMKDLVCLDGIQDRATVMYARPGPAFWGFPALNLNATPGGHLAGDLNQDGIEDLLVGVANQSQLGLFLGGPTGKLASVPVIHDIAFWPGAMAAIQADNDSVPEIVVLDPSTRSIVVMEYDESTGFSESMRATVGIFPEQVVVVDFDLDGHEDVAVLTGEAEEVRVLFGAGDGTLSDLRSQHFPIGTDWILPVDINADGYPDMTISDGHNRIWVRINQGDRTFAQESWYHAGSGATAMAAQDLDGDLDEDIVIANFTDGSLSFFENTSSGSLTRVIGGHVLPGRPAGLVVEDFDRDGKQDVMVNLPELGELALILGFDAWSYSLPIINTGSPEMASLGLGDYNLDGFHDLLLLDRSLQMGLTLMNSSGGQVAVAPTSLQVDCDAEGVSAEVRPDRPGSWVLEIGSGQAWTEVARDGKGFLGTLDYDLGAWICRIGPREILTLSPDSRRLRLTVGSGPAEESLVVDLSGRCLEVPAAGRQLEWEIEPWPNPFNPRLQASFRLKNSGRILAGVYDLQGRRVETLREGWLESGRHDLTWDGRRNGRPAAAGMYLLRIESEEMELGRKILLLK